MGSDKSDDSAEKPVKHNKRKRRRESTPSSDSSSSSIDEALKEKLLKKLKKLKKKEKKKRKKKKKKEKDREEKCKTNERKYVKETNVEEENCGLEKAKKFAPMTKEEWEKQRNTLRRVYDEETGRTRLVRGTGEIVEECVSRERQLAINKQATLKDGEYFQKVLSSNLK